MGEYWIWHDAQARGGGGGGNLPFALPAGGGGGGGGAVLAGRSLSRASARRSNGNAASPTGGCLYVSTYVSSAVRPVVASRT